MILKLLLITQMIWTIFIKRLKNTIQIRKKILIVFDDMIADMLSNKKFNPIITELFIRGRKLNICLVFITQSYFPVPRNIIQNSTHHLVIKIPHRRELQQITFNHSSDIVFQDYMNLYKKVNCKTIFVFGYWHYSWIS